MAQSSILVYKAGYNLEGRRESFKEQWRVCSLAA
jgi:hypothetical protein